jgi:hypothetical protein
MNTLFFNLNLGDRFKCEDKVWTKVAPSYEKDNARSDEGLVTTFQPFTVAEKVEPLPVTMEGDDTVKHVVAVGNAFGGIKLYGPFDDYDTALKYAEGHVGDDWHVIQLELVQGE